MKRDVPIILKEDIFIDSGTSYCFHILSFAYVALISADNSIDCISAVNGRNRFCRHR